MTVANGRRNFLLRAGTWSAALPALSPLAASFAAMAGQSAAGSRGGYKALVCVFLYGGNDSYNTVLATDPDSWAAYTAARALDGDNVALPRPGVPPIPGKNAIAKLGGVLPIFPTDAQGRSFALHPALGSVGDLFAAQRIAIVANVGPLVKKVTKEAYLAHTAKLPRKLFSHNDQQATWQTMNTEGTGLGWGGRMGDLLSDGNRDERFTSTSVYGHSAWLAGRRTRLYQLSPGGPVHTGATDDKLYTSKLAYQKLLEVMQSGSGGVLETDHSNMVRRSIGTEEALSGVMPSAKDGPWGTPGLKKDVIDPLLTFRNPFGGEIMLNPLAYQLQAVARMIATRQALGMSRQIFFVGFDGFDNHDLQGMRHAVGLIKLAHGLSYFDSVLRSMGVDENVTTFTASDFGRSFTSNGDGTDHGWGGHHFVMGGAVQGGNIYGNFPKYGFLQPEGGFDSPNQVDNGALLPTRSVEQYAATLGAWMGLGDNQLLSLLPALREWPVEERKMSFMRT